MTKNPRVIRVDDITGGGDVWGCWYCSRWGFLDDSDGRICEGCGNAMCEECASVHECVWA